MRILFWGDSPTVTTGFGVVSYNLLTRLKKLGHDITVLGINHWGDPYDQKEIPFPIYPCDKGSTDQIFGYAKLWWIAKQVKPDIIFMLNDPWVIDKAFSFRPPDTDPMIKYIAYYPIDAGPLKPGWAEMLTREFDAQVCYSHFAENIIIEANGGKRPDNLYQIYHGVDTNTFFPVNQQEVRLKLGLPLDSFIVGMVARNQYRKRFDLVVKAFSVFAKDKPNAKLYLHTGLEDVGFDIQDLVNAHDISDKLILTEGQRIDKGVPKEMLNYIYNSFDVNVLISLGDGFGLPVAESMATGVAQLVSDHSCLKELVEGHGGLTVKNAAWIMNVSGINTFGGVADVDDMVDKLNYLYQNKSQRIAFAEQGYQFITQPKFNWDVIANQFNDVIREIFHLI